MVWQWQCCQIPECSAAETPWFAGRRMRLWNRCIKTSGMPDRSALGGSFAVDKGRSVLLVAHSELIFAPLLPGSCPSNPPSSFPRGLTGIVYQRRYARKDVVWQVAVCVSTTASG